MFPSAEFKGFILVAWGILLLGTTCGCAPSGVGFSEAQLPARPSQPGTTPVALEFLYSFENEAGSAYYPLENLAGCEYSADGTLIFCDESRGKVYGLDSGTRNWYEFDGPMARPFRPVDVRVDGFKVLILDRGGGGIYRFDLSGSWQDQVLELSQIEPGVNSRGVAFDVDKDGRMIIADQTQLQVLLLDPFLSLKMRLGEPGRSDDQFNSLGGLAFLPDGSIIVSDPGNRRLCWYGRLGFFETAIGGDFDPNNPFVLPGGLDCDRFGNVFVADMGNSLIHVLDSRLRLAFSAGRGFDLRGTPTSPVDVAVGPDDLLAVTDQARSAILIYRIIYE